MPRMSRSGLARQTPRLLRHKLVVTDMLVRRLSPAALAAAVLSLPAVALAAADLEAGEKALKAAYQQTDGDEGGFGGTLVEQCRLDGENAVRCVLVDANGNGDLDSEDYSEQRTPLDFGVARFGPDGAITTSRDAFVEKPRRLDADIRVAERLRKTKLGRLAVRLAPDVETRVTVTGWFGNAEIGRRPKRSRTVTVAGGESALVALDLSKAQKRRISAALRTTGSIRAVITVKVVGDVGPADATDLRVADVRVVR